MTAARLLPTPWSCWSGRPCSASRSAIFGVQGGDAVVEIVDVLSEFAKAAGGGALGEAVAEGDLLELAQLALAVAADRPGFSDGIELRPVRPQALDRLGAIVNEATALELEHAEGANQLGLLGGSEIDAVAHHDLRDRQGVAGIGLPGPAAVALAVRPPGRDLQDLESCAGQRGDQAASVAARAFNADHGARGVPIDQPIDQLPEALRAVGDAQSANERAAVIDQRGGMRLLVNVDPDDQGDLLAHG
jgi:hypothetical protein